MQLYIYLIHLIYLFGLLWFPFALARFQNEPFPSFSTAFLFPLI